VLSAFVGAWGIVLGTFRLFGWHHAAADAHGMPANYGVMIACWLVLGLVGAVTQLRSGHRPRKKHEPVRRETRSSGREHDEV
jgi:hypothetical protein